MALPQIVVTTPAKVNLYLGVSTERTPRGLHAVRTVMTAVDLVDTLTLQPASTLEVACVPSVRCAPRDNLAARAALVLSESIDRVPDVRIVIDKRIPSQAGLGGGSSDAAATLVALARLWDLDPAGPEVVGAARAVGADVPFFLYGAPALMGGAGDVLERTFDPVELPVVLVRPLGPGVDTAEAYREFDRSPVPAADPAPLVSALEAGDACAVPLAVANNLDPVARRLLPAEEAVATWLAARPGVLASQVSGSGSCVFGFCTSHAAAEGAATDAARRGWWACGTSTRGGGPAIVSDTWHG